MAIILKDEESGHTKEQVEVLNINMRITAEMRTREDYWNELSVDVIHPWQSFLDRHRDGFTLCKDLIVNLNGRDDEGNAFSQGAIDAGEPSRRFLYRLMCAVAGLPIWRGTQTGESTHI